MPTYNLYCHDCLQEIEIECRISDYDNRMKNIVCPNCTSRNVYRDYVRDNIYSSVRDVKTIGQLADKNSKENKSKIQEIEAQKPKKQTPWYHNAGGASPQEINKMTKKQKKDYIMKGKK